MTVLSIPNKGSKEMESYLKDLENYIPTKQDVINYNLPDASESYVHRSGRTGRANKSGLSISIITPYEERKIRNENGL
jgi:hypothetical protein